MKTPTINEHIQEKISIGPWSSVFEALLRSFSTVFEVFLMPKIAT
jgi:hypothetical protein